MKENKNDINNQDQDYGFPFVELIPLSQTPMDDLEKAEVGEVETEQVEEDLEQPTAIITKLPEEKKEKQDQIFNKKSGVESDTGIRKKSSSPIIFVLTLLIIGILGSMAYFLYYLPNVENTQSQEASEVVDNLEISEEASGETSEPEVIVEEIEEEVPLIPEPQLTIIDSREATPRYFIIVGSVISERYAREEVKQYLEKGHDTWIIFPYGDIRNYRIAVGKFDNIETATEAWKTAKSEFGDAIWILKY